MRLSRRDFLKLGSAAAALLALEKGLERVVSADEGPGKSVSRTTRRLRLAVPSTCQLCPAHCGIIGFVEDGRLAKIEGNPLHPNNQGRICAKGQAGRNLVYDPDRLLYPLRRVGPRGEGQWQRISWEEAYQELASRLKALREGAHPEEFIFQAGTASTQTLVTRFMQAFGTPNAINRMPHGDENKLVAQTLTWGAPIEVSDASQARYILNFGANPFEAHMFHIPLAQRIVEARVRGAKLVTFDVRLSNTAGKSDEWFPLRPGTDGLVVLAMSNVIMQEDLHDRKFLENFGNYPVEALARYLAQYTPEWAEQESGMKAADIRRIAREFAAAKPATTIAGTGLSMHYNGVQNERCVALLNAITGNVDVTGGYCLPRSYEFVEPALAPLEPRHNTELSHPTSLPFNPHAPLHAVMKMIKEGKQKVGVYMTYMHNPAYSNPDHQLSMEVLRDEKLIPFFVAVDIYLSESAALADLVLPDATYLERWDLDSSPAFEMVPFVSLRQPVVKPRGEAVPFHDVLFELARRIGGGMERYFTFGGAEEYITAMVKGIRGLAEAGGMDYLKKNGVWFDPTAKPHYECFLKEGFKTPSGKFEIYSRPLEENGFPALPTYIPLNAPKGLDEDEFFLVTYKWHVLTSWGANAKWLAEIAHTNPVWMNPETAKTLGIKRGDQVKITSPLGSLTTKVLITQGIHPRVVAISGSLGHWGLGRIAQAKKGESNDPDSHLVWWQKHGNGVCPNGLIPVQLALTAGGQGWHDTRVRVARV